MSKLSFRARALDANKPLAVYHSDREPDILNENAAISRSVLALPTGMEKEEEEEHHIQAAINSTVAIVIPTPETYDTVPYFDAVYLDDFKLPRDYIRINFLLFDEELPEYDMDSEDEEFLNEVNVNSTTPMSKLDFEVAMDKLDKASVFAPVTRKQVRDVYGEETELNLKIFEFYKNKIKHLNRPFVTPRLKPDLLDSASSKDPYVCFRKRVERMQTRKNRKNDEASYMNMLKLKRDFERLRELLQMVKERETLKRTLIDAELELYDRRLDEEDWEGSLLASHLQSLRPAPQNPSSFISSYPHPHHSEHALSTQQSNSGPHSLGSKHAVGHSIVYDSNVSIVPQQPVVITSKKEYKKKLQEARALAAAKGGLDEHGGRETTEDGELSDSSAATEPDEDKEDKFRFRRRARVLYHAPLDEFYVPLPLDLRFINVDLSSPPVTHDFLEDRFSHGLSSPNPLPRILEPTHSSTSKLNVAVPLDPPLPLTLSPKPASQTSMPQSSSPRDPSELASTSLPLSDPQVSETQPTIERGLSDSHLEPQNAHLEENKDNAAVAAEHNGDEQPMNDDEKMRGDDADPQKDGGSVNYETAPMNDDSHSHLNFEVDYEPGNGEVGVPVSSLSSAPKRFGPHPSLRGLCRRRIGRGGRIFIDRMHPYEIPDHVEPLNLQSVEDHYAYDAMRAMMVEILKHDPSSSKNSSSHGNGGGPSVSSSSTPLGPLKAVAQDRLDEKSAVMPKKKASKKSLEPRLPIAGTDFGDGGEDVASGPKVKVSLSGTPHPNAQGSWVNASLGSPHHNKKTVSSSPAHQGTLVTKISLTGPRSAVAKQSLITKYQSEKLNK